MPDPRPWHRPESRTIVSGLAGTDEWPGAYATLAFIPPPPA